MDTTSQPILEARPVGQVWLVPLLIVGMTVLLAIAWVILNLLGGTEGLELVGLVFLLGGIFSLGVAGMWAWGIRRARLVVTRGELTSLPILGRTQSVSLSRLATVRLGQAAQSASVPTLDLSDADGGATQIPSKAWEREADILRAIGEAAERSGAAVSPDARDAISRGSIRP